MEREQKKDNQQKISAPADSTSVSVRLRDTWLGQFYFNHLKKHTVVKLVAPWVWRKMYFLYLIIWIFRNALKRPLLPLSNHVAIRGKIFLSKTEVVTPLPPAGFPKKSRDQLLSPQAGYEFPEIYIAEVDDAVVTGGTNLVMTDSSVICHDLYDFDNDYTSEELHGKTYIWPHRHRIAWLMRTNPSDNFDQVACFTDACAKNYAHWMTETLPRINLFCSVAKYKNVPLIVDDGLHRNLMSSLRTVTGDARKILTIPAGHSISVAHLLLTSCAGYVPFDRRHKKRKKHSHGRFSPFALKLLRKNLQERLQGENDKLSPQIFIKRNSNTRNIVNEREIEDTLAALGFSVVDPEQLTFDQQVAIFSNADIVVGATGAAMANLIFCKPTTKIIIMISDYKYISYWYWQNMACAVGNKVTYVFGRCIDSKISSYHSDFTIRITDLIDAIGSPINSDIDSQPALGAPKT